MFNCSYKICFIIFFIFEVSLNQEIYGFSFAINDFAAWISHHKLGHRLWLLFAREENGWTSEIQEIVLNFKI